MSLMFVTGRAVSGTYSSISIEVSQLTSGLLGSEFVSGVSGTKKLWRKPHVSGDFSLVSCVEAIFLFYSRGLYSNRKALLYVAIFKTVVTTFRIICNVHAFRYHYLCPCTHSLSP